MGPEGWRKTSDEGKDRDKRAAALAAAMVAAPMANSAELLDVDPQTTAITHPSAQGELKDSPGVHSAARAAIAGDPVSVPSAARSAQQSLEAELADIPASPDTATLAAPDAREEKPATSWLPTTPDAIAQARKIYSETFESLDKEDRDMIQFRHQAGTPEDAAKYRDAAFGKLIERHGWEKMKNVLTILADMSVITGEPRERLSAYKGSFNPFVPAGQSFADAVQPTFEVFDTLLADDAYLERVAAVGKSLRDEGYLLNFTLSDMQEPKLTYLEDPEERRAYIALSNDINPSARFWSENRDSMDLSTMRPTEIEAAFQEWLMVQK